MDYKRLNNVVLFDGVCNLCNRSVDLLIRKEKGNELLFASLQSEVGRVLIEQSGLNDVPDSILFYSDGELYARSEAVMKAAVFLRRPYKWIGIFSIVPVPIRDYIYNLIARNRYSWFGKKETCRVPTEAERKKILG
ncbi:MAG: thiol-disulfide oxidoreductase [Bacteroidetes bacterium]|nr:MAG: thiol-disulfide oxidoreductase [Bacteroidota bacterium]